MPTTTYPESTPPSATILSLSTKAKLLADYLFDGTTLPSFLAQYKHVILAFSGGAALAYFFQHYRRDKEKIQLAIFHVLKVVQGLSEERLRDPERLVGDIQGAVRGLMERHLTRREAGVVMKECKRRAGEMADGNIDEKGHKGGQGGTKVGGDKKKRKVSVGSKMDDREKSVEISIVVKKNRDISVSIENLQRRIVSRAYKKTIQKSPQEKMQTTNPTSVSRASFCALLQEGQLQGKLLEEEPPHLQVPNSAHTAQDQLQHDKQLVDTEMMDIDDRPIQVQNHVVPSNLGPDSDASTRIPAQMPSPAWITTGRNVKTPESSHGNALHPLPFSHKPYPDPDIKSHTPISAPQSASAPSKGYGFSYDDAYLYPTSPSSSSTSPSSLKPRKGITTPTAASLPKFTRPPSPFPRASPNISTNNSPLSPTNKVSIPQHNASTDLSMYKDHDNRTPHHNSRTPSSSSNNSAEGKIKEPPTSPPAARICWSSPLLAFSDSDNGTPGSPLPCVSISPLGNIATPPWASPVSAPSLSPRGGE